MRRYTTIKSSDRRGSWEYSFVFRFRFDVYVVHRNLPLLLLSALRRYLTCLRELRISTPLRNSGNKMQFALQLFPLQSTWNLRAARWERSPRSRTSYPAAP